jgi:hypothetical protein
LEFDNYLNIIIINYGILRQVILKEHFDLNGCVASRLKMFARPRRAYKPSLVQRFFIRLLSKLWNFAFSNLSLNIVKNFDMACKKVKAKIRLSFCFYTILSVFLQKKFG